MMKTAAINCLVLYVTHSYVVFAAGLSDETVTKVQDNLLQSAKASWELGTSAEALTELRWPSLSVFSPNAVPPPTQLNASLNASDVLNIAKTIVQSKPPDIMALTVDGSAGDPASLGVAVLLANWTKLDPWDGSYSFAAGQQLNYLLNYAPRTPSGAISHRTDQPQLWSDFVYMVPPFIAYFGALNGGSGELPLLQIAYDQCRLYREALRTPESGLWKHVAFGSWQDDSHWATGNAWAAAGMLRVLETLKHSNQAAQLVTQQADLRDWIAEILNESLKYQQPNGTMLNVIDDPFSFADSSSTALLGSVAFRMLTVTNATNSTKTTNPSSSSSTETEPTNPLLTFANNALTLVNNSISPDGWLLNTVDPYQFWAAALPGVHSPESQAFVLLLHAAWRDYVNSSAAGVSTRRALYTDSGTTKS